MMQVMQQPRRMRFSWESRCRVVALIDSGDSTDLVFRWATGAAIHPAVLTRTFQRLVKDAGVPAIPLHDLRGKLRVC